MENKKTVVIFGAGIAGLSAAHELCRLGHQVSIYEANSEAGGFFRSARRKEDRGMPSEYSWHGMGPWYHNVFDIMKQIPFDESGSVYDKALSRPIDFGIFPDDASAQSYDENLKNIPLMFQMTRWEWLKWFWPMIKTWSANERSAEYYARLNAAKEWKPLLSERAYRTWRSCFGPWIGSDWTNVSLHTTGHFFRRQLMTKPTHFHPSDEEGPAWTHGQRDGWLLLRGPSNEFWFDKWVSHLKKQNCHFYWNQSLAKFSHQHGMITHAHLDSGETIQSDRYILASNPFAAKEIIASSKLEHINELSLFSHLVQDGPHTQVSFRIAFSEPIAFPRKRTAIIVSDSEFNLTLFAQEQAWRSDVDLGENIKSLWTGTSCAATVPGRIYHLPVLNCTKEQFIEEVQVQILSCESLNQQIKEANHGRSLKDFKIERIDVWHEWKFSPQGIQCHQPKWVTTTHTQAFRPKQTTPIANLFFAGAHTRTEVDVWSIEGAVESGRRAAQAIEPNIKVLPQYTPFWLKLLSKLDDFCFRIRAPHILVIIFYVLLLAIVFAILIPLWHKIQISHNE